MRNFLPLVFAATLHFHAQAQDSVSLFNNYYKKGIEKLQDLYGYRGRTTFCDSLFITNPVENIERLMWAYGLRSEKIGLLFYSLSQDSLRIWLYRDGRLMYSIQKVTENNLIQAEKDLRLSLKVDELSASRLPKKRGVIVSNSKSSKSITLDEAIKNATSILFPEKIAINLRGLKHLIIMPEFNIGQFPLYILKPYGNDSYLIDSLSLSFAPHFCNLEVVMEKEGRVARYKPKNPLVVGNPLFSKNTKYVLPSLVGAEAEAKEVAALLETNALTGKHASIGKIVGQARTADFLYFATHGVFDPKTVLDGSFLAFSPDSSSNTGFWTARKIQESKLKARLAILSACQTGVGKVLGGGFIGIGRAFFIAGVDNTIMSLWSVDDESTKKLMLLFVKNLMEPNEFFPASHLRKAILEYKKLDKNPAHWAPFMDFGFPY